MFEQVRALAERQSGTYESLFIAKRCQHRAVFVLSVFVGGGVIETDNAQLAGKCFGDDVAKSIGQAWKQKNIAAGVIAGEFFSTADARADNFRMTLTNAF